MSKLITVLCLWATALVGAGLVGAWLTGATSGSELLTFLAP